MTYEERANDDLNYAANVMVSVKSGDPLLLRVWFRLASALIFALLAIATNIKGGDDAKK